MSIPHKGSRRIVVGGVEYRWVVRRRPTYSQGNAWSPLTVAVETGSGGRTLVVVFDKPRSDNWVGEEGAVAKPADATEAIQAAKVAGWEPGVDGGPVFFELSTGELRSSQRDG